MREEDEEIPDEVESAESSPGVLIAAVLLVIAVAGGVTYYRVWSNSPEHALPKPAVTNRPSTEPPLSRPVDEITTGDLRRIVLKSGPQAEIWLQFEDSQIESVAGARERFRQPAPFAAKQLISRFGFDGPLPDRPKSERFGIGMMSMETTTPPAIRRDWSKCVFAVTYWQMNSAEEAKQGAAYAETVFNYRPEPSSGRTPHERAGIRAIGPFVAMVEIEGQGKEDLPTTVSGRILEAIEKQYRP
ncbi:MAG: hypothetical protein K1X53_14225 [Candidatus Sumerlaeaceae bacterium]|nr:hypothetical protein [Candidatus Sumerlaeaceae bacterium]